MGDKLKPIGNRILDDLKKNWGLIAVIFGFWLFMVLIFHRFCPFVLFCGFPCPGCGMTRAFFSFFTLHPIRAFEYNPVYPLWLLTLVAMAFRRYVQGKDMAALRKLFVVVALATIIVYVIRMVYAFPGQEPMVYVHENLLSKIIPGYDQFMPARFD